MYIVTLENNKSKILSSPQDCPRYKRLDKRPDVRKGQVLKYIGSVQVGSTQERSHITEELEEFTKQDKLK